MSLYELYLRDFFNRRPLDLEQLVERVLQVDNPELVVESRGGRRDLGRDVVIKARRSDPKPTGVVQASAQERWRTKFRAELRKFIMRVREGVYPEMPSTWRFVTTQEVHVRVQADELGEGDKDDELRWARDTLVQADLVNVEVEIWGLCECQPKRHPL